MLWLKWIKMRRNYIVWVSTNHFDLQHTQSAKLVHETEPIEGNNHAHWRKSMIYVFVSVCSVHPARSASKPATSNSSEIQEQTKQSWVFRAYHSKTRSVHMLRVRSPSPEPLTHGNLNSVVLHGWRIWLGELSHETIHSHVTNACQDDLCEFTHYRIISWESRNTLPNGDATTLLNSLQMESV